MRGTLAVGLLLLLAEPAGGSGADVVVYGATPAGIAAALSAARSGRSVTLVEPARHVGGMTSGGLGWDDVDCSYCPTAGGLNATTPPPALHPAVYGSGLYTEFSRRVAAHYRSISPHALNLSVDGTRHEPHVAEAILSSMLAEGNVTVRLGMRLVGVARSADRITAVTLESSATGQEGQPEQLSARVFVDGTYEGDLLAQAGAPWVMGREGRAEHGELNAGVVYQDWDQHEFLRGSTGAPDPAVPAMTWRLCFSTAADRVMLTSPPHNYNRSLYLGYLQDLAEGRMEQVWSAWSSPRALPPAGDKFDINCNPKNLGFIWAGPQKDELINTTYARRAELVDELRQITLGLLWFVQQDAAVPSEQRQANRRYGLCADEFTLEGEDNFPWQLYIREARRLVGRRLLTEHDLVPTIPDGRPPLAADSVTVGSFAIDSFPCSQLKPAVSERTATTALEGYVGMETELVAPSTLPAAMMLPEGSALSNLIVPTAVSATHVAFSAVRLEPTWMGLGSAAGHMAHLALQGGRDGRVGDVRTVELQRRLVSAGQPLAYFSDLQVAQAGWASLQLLAPHAFDAANGFEAKPAAVLPRAEAVHWIAAALRASNSTLGTPAPAGALLPQAPSGVAWADFRLGDAHFGEVAALATVGAATPKPGTRAAFRPREAVTVAELQGWVRSAAALLPGQLEPASAGGAAEAACTRAQAAALVVGGLLGGGLAGL